MIAPELRIKQAFLQLEFAIKVMCHFERRDIEKATFDRETVLRLPEDVVRYLGSSFNTYENLILAAQNVYSTALGLSAISLEAARVQAGIRNDPADVSDRGNLRVLVYQVRCAFAHDMRENKGVRPHNFPHVLESGYDIRTVQQTGKCTGSLF